MKREIAKAFAMFKKRDGRKRGMFSGLRRHINATTIVAVFALVFAMTGGAFAVTSKGGSPGKAVVAKSKVKTKTVRGPAGPRGVMGPAGSAGVQGGQGAQGPAGAQGPKGETGATGTTGVKGEMGPQGPQGKEGKEGAEGPEGPAGTGGAGGFPKTLESGDTETGTWVAYEPSVPTEYSWHVPISFSIPLKLPLGGSAVQWLQESAPSTSKCPGDAETPKASPGQFCLYIGKRSTPANKGNIEVFAIEHPTSKEEGSDTTGAIVQVGYEGPSTGEYVEMAGTWAVTGG